MRSFKRSEDYLARALKTIPLGSQTFSKSLTQFPYGVSPFFATHARGARLWDLDGNEYVDFINSLASVTLGYNDPDVMSAVRQQLESGTIFSLPHIIEAEVAELICEMVPCAEMVRFGKNGSDATAGAIRLARAYTGRDRVAVCGYHGWQDWYIGSTPRNRGVPVATRSLTHTFQYNDLTSLEDVLASHRGEFAAVILEPMNVTHPQPGFLEGVCRLAREHGALTIFDETITGFRFAKGGAQEYFGVTPDLACFGKGLANGYPVAAVVGRRDVMKLMEEIFFSFTFGGETLSLAAAKATLCKLRSEPVIETLVMRGNVIVAGLQSLLEAEKLEHIFSVSGHPAWTFLTIQNTPAETLYEIKTYLMQEMAQRGLLTLGSHNVSYAHTDDDVGALVRAYEEILPTVKRALETNTIRNLLRCEPLVPLFKVR
jgi:glutamate-1-semialdehyde 2,1-aminomutase